MENLAEYIMGGLIGFVALFSMILPKVVEVYGKDDTLPPDEGDEGDIAAHAETVVATQEQLDEVVGTVEAANDTVSRSDRLNRLAALANQDDA